MSLTDVAKKPLISTATVCELVNQSNDSPLSTRLPKRHFGVPASHSALPRLSKACRAMQWTTIIIQDARKPCKTALNATRKTIRTN